MTPTRTSVLTAARPARIPAASRPTRSPGAAMIGLQRSAGNASALALLRRARKAVQETPVTLTLPGVVDAAAVSGWSIENDSRGRPSALSLTRPTDTDSPVLAKALTDGAPGLATLRVRKLTAQGWIRDLEVTLDDCMVSAFVTHGGYESVTLSFTRMHVEHSGVAR